jgi:diguanylate cyclase (GGDEF)-like protein
MSYPAIDDRSALILLVDDDPLMRMQLCLCLKKEGYQVVEAKDGQEGLVAFNRLHPDIVLLDAVMPGIDGFECCAQLQTQPNGNHTPILIITGLDDQDSVDRAFEVGAADYVTKPVHWAVLRQRVRRLIRQSQLQRQLETLNQELHRLASVDGLTQIANRRWFDEYLQQEWQRTMREQLPLSLILCDVDCFKLYNDTYGHQAGDRCLQQVAKTLQATVKRSTDLVARYGGEEFAVILPNTSSQGAIHIAEEACAKIRESAIPHGSSLVQPFVTLSVGVASMVPSLQTKSEVLITRADQALYQAKASGRDRCCVSPEYEMV